MQLRAGLLAAVFAATFGWSAAQAQNFDFRIGMATGPDSPQNVAVVKMVDMLRERTGGKIDGQVFHSGSLGSTEQLLQSMALGTVDATITVALDTYIPKTGVFLLPFIFRDMQHFHKVVDDPITQEVVEEGLAKGLRVISVWDSGFRHIYTTTKEIKSLADLQGMKIRVPSGKVWIDTFKALGANPTPMAYGEVFTSLQQGVIDGMESPIPNFYANKLFEVAKNMAEVDYMAGPAFFVVSERWWNSLSDDLKKIVLETADEAKVMERQLNAESEKANLEAMKKAGLNLTHPSKEELRSAAKDVWPLYEERFGKELIDRIAAME